MPSTIERPLEVSALAGGLARRVMLVDAARSSGSIIARRPDLDDPNHSDAIVNKAQETMNHALAS